MARLNFPNASDCVVLSGTWELVLGPQSAPSEQAGNGISREIKEELGKTSQPMPLQVITVYNMFQRRLSTYRKLTGQNLKVVRE